MSLNQKVDFQNEVQDSNYREINLNSLFEWNSTSDPLLIEIDFFLVIRCNQELAGQNSSKFKVLRFSSEFQLIEVL
jgi:hypothetical protein